MSFQSIETTGTRSLDVMANRLMRRALKGPVLGRLLIELPRGAVLTLAGIEPGPQARLIIHRWRGLWRVIFGGAVGFAQSYMAGEWSTPDLPPLLSFMRLNANLSEPVRRLRPNPVLRRLRHGLNKNTRRRSPRNIAAHYDLGNAFYAHWLDPDMTYSSGIYSSGAQTLSEAQQAKLDRVVELLELSGGEHVLEIGCGWGGLAERLATRHGCRVTGLTLSSEQLAYALARLARTKAKGRCDFRLQDYRDADGAYDRIVSVEMLEAVGEAYWPSYFAALRDRLKEDGTAVLQVITIGEHCFEPYRRRPDFIQRYIFPGGMLPTEEIVAGQIRTSGLRLVSSEFFGEDYARTLADWRSRFKNAWPQIQALGFDARFRRMWEYYLSYCQVGFEAGVLNVGLYKISHARD